MRTNRTPAWTTAALTLLSLTIVAGCGRAHIGDPFGGDDDDDGQSSIPAVVDNAPLDNAVNVPRNAPISATFSEAMDPASLSSTTVTVTYGDPPVEVAGTVLYSNLKVAFFPNANLSSNETFTATINTGAKSVPGVSLAASHSWSFETSNTLGSGFPVDLGTAGNYAILAKSAISTVPASDITGDIAVSPAAATYITNFSLIADSTNTYATSTQVTGRVYAADYTSPTSSNLTTAVLDMQTAFTAAAARAPDATELGAGDIGGMNLAPGVYKWSSGLLIPTDVTLTGSATDVWIFQIAQNLTMASAKNITLAGGALPKNIFWQVSGQVTLGTTAHFEGVILCQTAIVLDTGTSVNGRLLAQTAVVLDTSTIVEPAE